MLAVLAVSCYAQQYTISTIAGGGPIHVSAITANAKLPFSVAWDSTGRFYYTAYNRAFRVNTSGVIDLVVGNGIRGASSGDGGPAHLAQLATAEGIAVDAAGNIYISDGFRVRKVTVATGIVSTYAGSSAPGNSGDGGPATSARLNSARGLSIDAGGNLFIADRVNLNVRRVAAGTGIVTTVAGGGTASPGDGGAATAAKLNSPVDVAVDASGNLFIADNDRVRKVAAGTGIIGTIAGGGTAFPGDGGPATNADLFSAVAVTFDGAGNVYFSDSNKIRKVAAGSGTLSTIVPGGSVTRAFGISSDTTGNLLFTDTDTNRVRKIAPGSTAATTVAGNGSAMFSGEGVPAIHASLNLPTNVVIDRAGNLYLSDTDNNRVRKIAAGTGIITTFAGTGAAASTGDGGLATAAALNGPFGLALDANENLFIAESYGYRVRKVTASTGVISTVGGNGAPGCTGDGGPATSATLSQPDTIAVDRAGNLYVGTLCETVRKVAAGTGIITTFAGGGTALPANGGSALGARLPLIDALATDADGNVFIATAGYRSIYRVSATTNTFTVLVPSSFGVKPDSLAVDAAGNVYFGAQDRHEIWRVPSGSSTPIVIAGTGAQGYTGDGGPALAATLGVLFDVEVDAAGNLYIVDGFYGRIRKLTPSSAGSPPSAPTLTTPADGATNLSLTPSLGWNLSSGATSYEVRFGITNPPPFYLSTSGTNTTLSTLQAGTTYYWQVQAIGPGGSALSQVRSLRTVAGVPPGTPTSPSPLYDATGIATSVTLSWAAASGATSYDVYLGVSSTPSLVATVNNPNYTVSGLSGTSVYNWRVVAKNAFGETAALFWRFTTQAAPPPTGNYFVPVPPCRLMDTRAGQGTTGNFGPPALNALGTRDLPVPTGRCNIPSNATAYSLNVTVVPQGPLGYVTLWPAGQSQPLASTLNALHGGILANAALVPAGLSGAISVFVTDKTDLILDINGYFTAGSGDAFATLDPCRLLDTRGNSGFSGAFGSPTIAALSSRSFPLVSGSCNVPSNATSYSLNATVVPPAALGYLTLWPSGQAQPVVSTLNNLDGTVLANAALVPAGTGGAVSAFVSNVSELILDINGYFRPSSVAGGLAFYPVTPCRVADTRVAGNGSPQMTRTETRDFTVAGRCGIPASAKAFAMNVTVVPPGPLGFLSLWPSGRARPLVSTLNSLLGRVLANAAIVPVGTIGQVSVYVTDAADVILDVNGFFQ